MNVEAPSTSPVYGMGEKTRAREMGDIKKHTEKKDPHIFYWKDPSWFSLRSGSSATNGRFHPLGGVNQSDQPNLLLFSGSDLILLPMTQLKTEKRQKESQIGDKSEMDRTNEVTCRLFW
jgi:hypothetical protein